METSVLAENKHSEVFCLVSATSESSESVFLKEGIPEAPGSVIDELTQPATFVEIKTDRSAMYVGQVQLQNNQRRFDVRSYLFPITKSVIQANSAISDADQNPGWE